jgi:hypothetical protein
MKKISRFILITILFFLFLTPFLAASIEFKSPIKFTTPSEIFTSITKFAYFILVPIAIIVVLIGAFQFLTAAGASDKISKAKQTIFYGVIGLAVVILAAATPSILINILGLESLKENPSLTIINSPEEIQTQISIIESDITTLQQSLAIAQEKGEAELAESISKKISQLETKKQSLALLLQSLTKLTETGQTFSGEWANFVLDSQAGAAFLAKYGIKNEEGWYLMLDGGRYNPETKTYIGPTGKIYTETRVLNEGAIMYCGQ